MIAFEAWAARQKLNGWAHSRYALLAELARRTQTHAGVSIVTVAELAESVGESVRNCQRQLADLERGKKLQRIARFKGRQLANAYRLLTEWVRAELEKAPAADGQSSSNEAAVRREPTLAPWSMGVHLDHHPQL